MGLDIYHLAIDKLPFSANGALAETGAGLAMAVVMLCIPAAALAKRLVRRGSEDGDEDET